MTTSLFLTELTVAVESSRAIVRTEFTALPLALLNQRPAPASWSILECLEHVNRYSRYYIPALDRALQLPYHTPALLAEVRYSWLGRKSVKIVHPTTAKKNVALKRMNPLGNLLDWHVLTEFDQYQFQLLDLLARARGFDLNRAVVPVEFFRLLKLRLGECLEFVVVHQQRHLQQAQRVQVALLD